MRYLLPTIILVLLGCSGCSRFDARLNGTWRSNREETVAAAFKRDPRWTNAPPEKVEKFRDIFGHMTVTYSKNHITSNYKGEESFYKYKLVEKGQDYVVIRTPGITFGNGLTRIRFVDQGHGIWVDSGKMLGIETPEEKFDRITEPSGAANRNQPGGSKTNRKSPAAGSGSPAQRPVQAGAKKPNSYQFLGGRSRPVGYDGEWITKVAACRLRGGCDFTWALLVAPGGAILRLG